MCLLTGTKTDYLISDSKNRCNIGGTFLSLDLREGGDLKFHLNKDELFSEERARFHAAEVLLGLEHIHSHGIIYRDMKLENILLDRKGTLICHNVRVFACRK